MQGRIGPYGEEGLPRPVWQIKCSGTKKNPGDALKAPPGFLFARVRSGRLTISPKKTGRMNRYPQSPLTAQQNNIILLL
jgi:hypothetical protein